MLACRTPAAGRRCGCCCWGAALFGAETLRALRGKEEGVLHPMLALHHSYTTTATIHTHLGAALDLGEPCWVGFGTGSPASTDDWREVGGSIAGCRTGSSSGAAKSRAAVPGRGPRKPSFTACVLALSCGASDEWGTCSDPCPELPAVASASLLRTERLFTLNLSMAAYPMLRKESDKHAVSRVHMLYGLVDILLSWQRFRARGLRPVPWK
jgi:hypothetical protein